MVFVLLVPSFVIPMAIGVFLMPTGMVQVGIVMRIGLAILGMLIIASSSSLLFIFFK